MGKGVEGTLEKVQTANAKFTHGPARRDRRVTTWDCPTQLARELSSIVSCRAIEGTQV